MRQVVLLFLISLKQLLYCLLNDINAAVIY